MEMQAAWLLSGGFASGILAGLLGIGGGTLLVPFLVALHYSPVQSVGSSSLAILLTSVSGTIQNYRMGVLQWRRILPLGLPAVLMAQVGSFIAGWLPARALLTAFGLLLLVNIYLVGLRRSATKLTTQEMQSQLVQSRPMSPLMAQLTTGGSAGLLAGLFGVGGGVIMVPLQMLLLQESLKGAIQTSLAVIPLTAVSATLGHAIAGNVVFSVGLWVGFGGLISAQLSTRILPQLPDAIVSLIFRTLLILLALYIFWQAWNY
jgi:uncharacterized protein